MPGVKIDDGNHCLENLAEKMFEQPSDFELLKAQWELSWAVGKNDELEYEKTKLKKEKNKLLEENQRLQNQINHCCKTAKVHQELRELNGLIQQVEDTKLELKMAKLSIHEADEVEKKKEEDRQNLSKTRRENERLCLEVHSLMDKLKALQTEHDALKKDRDDFHGIIAGLKATINSLRGTADALGSQVSAVTVREAEKDKELKKAQRETSFYKAKMQNVGCNLEESRSQLQKAIVDRDIAEAKHVQVLRALNAQRDEQTRDSLTLARLNEDLKETKEANQSLLAKNNAFSQSDSELRRDIRALNSHIATCITDLDLAQAGLRVFTCTHRIYRDIPDGENSIQGKCAGTIATELFRRCASDREFIREYMRARGRIIGHHKAHERAHQGRGDYASYIYRGCELQFQLLHELVLTVTVLSLDDWRGVDPTYYL